MGIIQHLSSLNLIWNKTFLISFIKKNCKRSYKINVLELDITNIIQT